MDLSSFDGGVPVAGSCAECDYESDEDSDDNTVQTATSRPLTSDDGTSVCSAWSETSSDSP